MLRTVVLLGMAAAVSADVANVESCTSQRPGGGALQDYRVLRFPRAMLGDAGDIEVGYIVCV